MTFRKLNIEGNLSKFKNITVVNAPERVAELLEHWTSIQMPKFNSHCVIKIFQWAQSGLC